MRKKTKQAHRRQSGLYMLELLVALTTSSILVSALIYNLAQTNRLSDAGQNQILAFAIAQEQIDNTRNTPYDSIPIGTYSLLINRTTAGTTGPVVNPRPLLLDLTELSWSEAGAKNTFPAGATATQVVETGPYEGTKRVTVTISWAEGEASRSLVLSTLVSRNGIHN